MIGGVVIFYRDRKKDRESKRRVEGERKTDAEVEKDELSFKCFFFLDRGWVSILASF